MVAALFVTEKSHYKNINGVDAYDISRDARTWKGGEPVVAHPPCRAWASLRHCAKPRPDEKQLAFFAIDQVRKYGGVLEHPHRSTLFDVAGLPKNGIDEYGGWCLVVDQNWFGHRAQKRTRLYICGLKPSELPPMPLRLGEATHTVGLWSGRDKKKCRPSISKKEFEETPFEFAKWLVQLAAMCRP